MERKNEKETSCETYHVSVMLQESVDALKVQEGNLYFDGTLGGGGHSAEILKRGGRLIAVDRDIEAIKYVQNKFARIPEYKGRYTLVHDNFKNVKEILKNHSIEHLDGAVLDLGVSSRQIDDKSRGFSYKADDIVDMRMDRGQVLSALTVINQYTEEELSRIIYTYGEERHARRIAREIVKARAKKPIEKTGELSQIILSCFPPFIKGGNPAKRTFQALRIEVNGELDRLSDALTDLVNCLTSGARIAVISFHSLEDRIAKQTFRALAADCVCDKSLPVCVCNHKATVRLPESKGKKPSSKEQAVNPRSASATLRVAEKL